MGLKQQISPAAQTPPLHLTSPVPAPLDEVALLVAEVEELVAPGQLDPDTIHTPGIYVNRIVQGKNYEKRIEQRTISQKVAA